MAKKPLFEYRNTAVDSAEVEDHVNDMLDQHWSVVRFIALPDHHLIQWRREVGVTEPTLWFHIWRALAAILILAMFAAAFHHMMQADAATLCDRTDKADVCAQAGVRP